MIENMESRTRNENEDKEENAGGGSGFAIEIPGQPARDGAALGRQDHAKQYW